MAQISHDLRTPLNAVIGFSDVLSAELLGPVGHPRYREYAGDIRDSGRRLLKAAEDTLAMTALLAEPSQREARPCGLEALVLEAWRFLAPEAELRGITLSLDSEQGASHEVLAPVQSLRQTLINMLTEALERAPDGGLIELAVVPEDDTVRVELRVACATARTAPASLPMCLARALLELQGAGLIEIKGQDGTWRAVTVLDRAMQRELFTGVGAAEYWSMAAAGA